MKKKIIQLTKIVLSLGLFIALFLILNRSYQQNIKESQQVDEETKLNIALVNEDRGIVTGQKQYNLGANYVKKIEKDTKHNWYVVSRGIGESGLKDDTYQLLVIIPNNFSAKILDLNNQAPEQLNLSYKVNANGNSKLEDRSKETGRQIVNDLNQQLVNMYVASILDNLYTAQKNIKRVADVQSNNIGSYENQVYKPAAAFQDTFPSLVDESKMALESNNGLTKTLETHTESINSLLEAQNHFDDSLQKLIESRQEGKITYEEFASHLLDMNTDVLSDQTQELYNSLSTTAQNFQNEFHPDDEHLASSFNHQMDVLSEKLDRSQEQLEEEVHSLEAKIANIIGVYRDNLYGHYGISEATDETPITLGDFLEKSNTNELDQLNTALKNLDSMSEERIDFVQARLNELPYNDPATLENLSLLGDNGQIQAIQANIQSIQEQLNTSYKTGFTFEGNQEEQTYIQNLADSLSAARTNAGTNLQLALNNLNLEEVSQISFTSTAPNVTFNDIKVNGVSLDLANPIWTPTPTEEETEKAEPVKSIMVDYTINAVPAEADQLLITVNGASQMAIGSNDPSLQIEQQNAKTWVIAKNLSATLESNQDYQTAKRAYSEMVGRITERYQAADRTLTHFNRTYSEEDHALLDNILSTDVSKGLKTLLNVCFSSELNKQYQKMQELKEKADAYKEQIGVPGNETSEGTGMFKQLAGIQRNNAQLQVDLQNQLDKLSEWREKMNELVMGETKVAGDNNNTDSQIDANKQTNGSLIDQSKALRESSEHNVESSDNVKQVFTAFEDQVKQAQSDGKQLSSSANKVMDDFNEELEKNHDFVASFIKVLSNAHDNGVSNETLLQFISNPVVGKSEQSVKSGEINKPFIWIIVLFATSLFIAHIFATQDLVSRVKTTFQREALWFEDNIMHTLLLFATSVLVGGIIGFISMKRLAIAEESRVTWCLVMILIMIVFTLLNHYLLKQFKIGGLGVSLALLISYLFVTSAINTTTVLDKFSSDLKRFSPLIISEQSLNTFFNQQSLDLKIIATALVVAVLLFVLNLFIWQPKLKQKEV